MTAFIKEKWTDVLAWFVAVVTIAFALANHFGWIDQVRGLRAAQDVADRYDLSYGPDAPGPIYASDPAWPALIRVITKYSHDGLPREKRPIVIARFQALLSVVDTKTPGMPQWTAPTTEFAVIYRMWPGAGDIHKEDYRVVGSIQDLHDWIKRDSDDFHFWCSDVLLASLTLLIAIGPTLARRRRE